MKKFMAILLAVALSAATLTACTTKKEYPKLPKSAATSKVTLRSTFTKDDWMTATFTLAAEDSGVEYVNGAAHGDDSYKNAVVDEFLSGKDPDVVYFWMGSDSEPLVKSNRLISIDEIKKDYPQFAADHDLRLIASCATASNGKQYFIPGPGYSEALFYNKKVLEAVGVSIPDASTTYEKWVADLKKIKAAGYTPLSTVFNSAEGIHYLWEYTSYNNETDIKNHGDYTKNASEASAFAKGLEDIKALYTEGLLHPKADSASNADAFNDFVANKAAFYVGGSWNYSVNNPDIGVTYFPAKAGSNRKSTDAIGGISMGFAISRSAYENPEKREKVVKFVDTITSAEALLSYGEWRSYTLSANAAASKTRAYVTTDADGLLAKRIADGAQAAPLSETLKTALYFNAGLTWFAGAVQDNMPAAAKTVLFEQAPSFFKGTGTAAAVIAAANAA
jgi:raffinose/stachyose/melibiose transport system substrate-binding protein